MRPSAYTIIAVLLLAATIHVASVLSLPYLAEDNGWTRLSALGDTNTLIHLPAASPGRQTLPLMAPDIRYAFCRYQLDQGPVRLVTEIPDELWMIAFYSPRGDNFYTISGADIQRDKIEIIISTEAEVLPESGPDAPDDVENIVVVRVTEPTGLVLVRAPLPGPSYAGRIDQALARASCGRLLRKS